MRARTFVGIDNIVGFPSSELLEKFWGIMSSENGGSRFVTTDNVAVPEGLKTLMLPATVVLYDNGLNLLNLAALPEVYELFKIPYPKEKVDAIKKMVLKVWKERVRELPDTMWHDVESLMDIGEATRQEKEDEYFARAKRFFKRYSDKHDSLVKVADAMVPYVMHAYEDKAAKLRVRAVWSCVLWQIELSTAFGQEYRQTMGCEFFASL